MTTIPDEQTLRSALEQAPANVRTFVTSNELLEIFDAIRTEHKLHFDEAEKLTDALVAVFVELQPLSAFPELLKEALEQNAQAYDGVLKDVNEKIFVAFRNTLQGAPAAAVAPKVPQAPALAPVPTPTPQPALPKTPLDRLKETSRTVTESVAVQPNDTSATTPHAAVPPPASSYPSTDPYREPIE